MVRSRPRIGRRRIVAVASVALALTAATLAAPANAHAVFGLPGPSDIAGDIFKWFLETFFGIRADATQAVLRFLVAFPLYTNASRYGELNDLRAYITAGAWGIYALVFTASCLRYWAAGFTQASTYAALEAMGRSVVAGGALAVYPTFFQHALVTGNLTTSALVDAPHVRDGILKALVAGFAMSFDTLGIGTLAAVVSVVLLVLLIVSKIVVSTLLAILYVAGPLAIALWPLPESAWLARTWAQSVFATVLWPVVWSLCFAVFGVMSASSFTGTGRIGDELIKPWIAVAALYAAFKLPQLVGRQAMLAGLTPSLGRTVGQAMVYGRAAQGGTASSATGSAAKAAGGAA